MTDDIPSTSDQVTVQGSGARLHARGITRPKGTPDVLMIAFTREVKTEEVMQIFQLWERLGLEGMREVCMRVEELERVTSQRLNDVPQLEAAVRRQSETISKLREKSDAAGQALANELIRSAVAFEKLPLQKYKTRANRIWKLLIDQGYGKRTA